MKVIKNLVDQIREELEDAKKYARCAAMQEEDRKLAETYAALAREELGHANQLHDHAARIIKESGKEAPPAMKAVWEWEHQKMIDDTAAVRILLELKK